MLFRWRYTKSNQILNIFSKNRMFWWWTSENKDSKEVISEIEKPGPKELYLSRCDRGLISNDPIQSEAIDKLDILNNNIKLSAQFDQLKGIYLYGGVGRGKTMIMDLFYNSLDIQGKNRLHFHSWMLEVHRMLHNNRGNKDPLNAVAAIIAKKSKIICLDEFEITDVADAFVIRWLFDKLWTTHGVLFVFTSNAFPDKLYDNGINRSSFLPFIEQLKTKCESVSLDILSNSYTTNNNNNKLIGVDYRSLTAPLVGGLYCCNRKDFHASWNLLLQELGEKALPTSTGATSTIPTTDTSSSSINNNNNNINNNNRVVTLKRISVGGREIVVPISSGKICRFTFEELCGSLSPKGASDYLSLSEHYQCIAIEGVPVLGRSQGEDVTRRFITLIDVIYEAKILLLLLAEDMPHELFNWHSHSHQISNSSIDDISSSNNNNNNEGADVGVEAEIEHEEEEEDVIANNLPITVSSRTANKSLENDNKIEMEEEEAAYGFKIPYKSQSKLSISNKTTKNKAGCPNNPPSENSSGGELRVTSEGGSSSSRNTTMFRSPDTDTDTDSTGSRNGLVEWSGTGLKGASLANLSTVGGAKDGFSSFTEKATSRTISRLLQMAGKPWLEDWVEQQRQRQRDAVSSTSNRNNVLHEFMKIKK